MANPEGDHGELIERDVFDLLTTELEALQPEDRTSPVVWQRSWPRLRALCMLDDADRLKIRMDADRISTITRVLDKLDGLVSFLSLLHQSAEEQLHEMREEIDRGICSVDPSLGSLHDELLREMGEKVDHDVYSVGNSLEVLPDELLMRIVTFACSKWRRQWRPSRMKIVEEMLNLSHVNKRFRNVTLDMPEMWAVTSPATVANCNFAEALLVRSKSAGWLVDLHQDAKLPLFLDKFHPLAHRWKELYFCVDRYHRDVRGSELWNRCIDLDLPNLEHFEYDHGSLTIASGNAPAACNERIYSNWKMPRLREIRFRGMVPDPFLASTITVVSVEFLSSDFLSYYSSEFHSFLQSTPTIETLRLSDISLDFKDHSSDSHANFTELTLKNIHTIEISCKYMEYLIPEERNYDEFYFCRFIQSIHVPKLRRLKIDVRLDFAWVEPGKSLDNFNALVFSLCPGPFLCSPVQNLDVRICGQTTKEGDRSCNSFIAFPFERFPALRILSVHIAGILGAPRLLPDGLVAPHYFPALERLEVSKCWGGALPFIHNVIKNVRKSNGSRQKVAVSVDKCAYVRKEELLEFIEKRDLVFQEWDVTKGMDDPEEWVYGYIPHPSELPILLSSIGLES